MNDSADVIRRPRRPRPPARAALVALAIAVALLAAACSGGRPSTGSGASPGSGAAASSGSASSAGSGGSPSAAGSSSRQRLAIAYSRCMRSHGVTQYPDPGPASSGYAVPVIPPAKADSFGVSASVVMRADHACQALLPPPSTSIRYIAECTVDNDCSQSLLHQYAQALLKFARCMRTHGVSSFPDPTWRQLGDSAQTYPVFWIPKSPGFDPHSSQVVHIMNDECDQVAGVQAIAIDGPGA